LSGSNFFEHIPKGVFQGHAGLMSVELDASFGGGFPAWTIWVAQAS
jgi:hypothetical protein